MTLVWGGSTYDTDKYPALIALYDRFLDPLQDQPIVLLELGVGRGGSLLFWRDYFPRGVIVGLDVEPVCVADPSGRVHVYQGRQEDVVLLDRITAEVAPEGFTVVIDDAAHIGEPTCVSFWHLFRNHLRPGGVYAIEDWGTGYWDAWPDGKRYESPDHLPVRCGEPDPSASSPVPGWFPSHQYGMVGFVKQLIDEVGAEDATRPGPEADATRRSAISGLHIFPGLVVAVKAADCRLEART